MPDTGRHVSVVPAGARSGIRLRREDPGLWLMLARQAWRPAVRGRAGRHAAYAGESLGDPGLAALMCCTVSAINGRLTGARAGGVRTVCRSREDPPARGFPWQLPVCRRARGKGY